MLAVGTEFGETDWWLTGTRPRLGGRLIRVDIDARQLIQAPWADIGIVSDAGEALVALARASSAFPLLTQLWEDAKLMESIACMDKRRGARSQGRARWTSPTALFRETHSPTCPLDNLLETESVTVSSLFVTEMCAGATRRTALKPLRSFSCIESGR